MYIDVHLTLPDMTRPPLLQPASVLWYVLARRNHDVRDTTQVLRIIKYVVSFARR